MLALAAPGWEFRRSRRWGAVTLLGLGVAAPIAFVVAIVASGRTWVALSLDRTFLAVLIGIVIGFVAARLIAVWWWFGSTAASTGRRSVAIGAALLLALPGLLVATGVVRARHQIAPVFTPTPGGRPLFDAATAPPTTPPPATSTTTTQPVGPTVPTTVAVIEPGPATTTSTSTSTTTLPPLPEAPDSGVDPSRLADVHTVLLLGGDAGPGRTGLRTDSMILLSVHTPSGRASLISIPRDLRKVLFPPGTALEARYPYGFDNIANAVYPIVSADRSLRDEYRVGDIRPGVVAIAQAIGYSLDVTIHDYVLIDMQGFIGLIDALGGVTVDVSKTLPMPGNVPGAPGEEYPETIGPGLIHMDGTIALGYVRSRHADSDYQRTRRQRKLLAALARQVSWRDVVTNYGGVMNAIGGTLRTSLSADELAELLALIGGETAIVESVGLVPPLVSANDPDYQDMAEIVGQVLLAIAEGHDSGY